MLVLFETPAGYALFKVKDDSKLSTIENISAEFDSPSSAKKMLSLKDFCKFPNTTAALESTAEVSEGKVSSDLKEFIKSAIVKKQKNLESTLAVADPKLAIAIGKKFGIKCVSDATVHELMRGIRLQLGELIDGIKGTDMDAMALGLSHSMSRHKIRFSADKVDTMIVQAISLLDDLDKELNTYSMRLKEWYGWHFPELAKIVVDNGAFARVIKVLGFRTNAPDADLDSVLPEELVKEVRAAADLSMGTEISDFDLVNISALADQVISIGDYRVELYEYLKNRMNAIAPSLTAMVGELVGARLIAHAGSLLNLAKHPASTVQILGAEKALFRALKTKTDTPKYGLIYHASLVGQAAQKMKGKISRVLAAKTALAVRCDALGDNPDASVGLANRQKVENRLAQLENRVKSSFSGHAKHTGNFKKYDFSAKGSSTTIASGNNVEEDSAMPQVKLSKEPKLLSKKEKKALEEPKEKKRDREEDRVTAEASPKKSKKSKEEKEAKKKSKKSAEPEH